MTSLVFLLIVVFTAYSRNVNGFNLQSCTDLTPNDIPHPPQTSTPPYEIAVSSEHYQPGVPVIVTLKAIAAYPPVTFTDFLLVAQCDNCAPKVPVGAFTYIPAGTKILPCYNTHGAVTAADRQPKTSLMFKWNPPHDPPQSANGPSTQPKPHTEPDIHVIFRASVLKGDKLWWANIVSPPLKKNWSNNSATTTSVPLYITVLVHSLLSGIAILS